MDSSASLRRERDNVRRRTETWMLEVMLARGSGAPLTSREHLRLLKARQRIEHLTDQIISCGETS